MKNEQEHSLEKSLEKKGEGPYLNLEPFADRELWPIFIEEAKEIAESLQKALELFLKEKDAEQAQVIKRQLHTLKGNARMVKQPFLAEVCHALEGILAEVLQEWNDTKVSSLQKGIDWIAIGVEALNKGVDCPPDPAWLLEVFQGKILGKEKGKEKEKETSPAVHKKIEAQKIVSPMMKEMLRLPAEMIDTFSDLAVSISVSRVSLEQRMTKLSAISFDLGSYCAKLRDHVRQLEQENELNSQKIMSALSPIRSRKESSVDLLQLERYSFFEYLARNFIEVTHELYQCVDLLKTHLYASHEVLGDQSKTTSALEKHLSLAKRVSFNAMIPRLQRIARQVSVELNKQVELTVENGDLAIDRSILSRLTPALEHLIRNAIDHGIETAQEREFLGKERKGSLRLALARKGIELQVMLSDDGAGINVEMIRQLAIEKGLIPETLQLSEEEIFLFIFHTGITTKNTVTEISGRGVGMDVVDTEVKSLGGNIRILSQKNKGTRFIISVPLDLSLTQVLVFKTGQEYYAMELAHVSGVIRVPQQELLGALEEVKQITYLNNEYQVCHLSKILGSHGAHEKKQILPVILVMTGTARYCLIVSDIIGSREMFLKPLGNQLRTVPGITGASLLEDGHLVVLLDVFMMIDLMKGAMQRTERQESTTFREPLILVVDDSMTVRRVTQRILEKNAFQSLLAKDGVDARELMRNQVPNLVITDLEMPRMDGYELIKEIRQEKQFCDIPIIVITSRDTELHRRQAHAAGATVFLNKPLDETVLVSTIHSLLAVGKKKEGSA